MRGITSSVNIVWRRNGTLVNTTRVTATIMDSFLVYTDHYTISPVSTFDDGVKYSCRLVVHGGSRIIADDVLSLDVTGELSLNANIILFKFLY